MDHCQQCGTCCRKGGPAIHLKDKNLLENGHIPLRSLFTIRPDEPVYDNVQGNVISAPSDIIRIKALKDSTACMFFNPPKNRCLIYDHRPLECRTLKCWDTQDIENIYNTERLSRKDILKDIPHIYQLLEYHEQRCAYEKIKKLINHFDQHKDKSSLDNIREMMAFDNHFRSLVIEKSILKPDTLDFLFGLPLQETLPRLGLPIKIKKDK